MQPITVELHHTHFEVHDPFGEALVIVRDAPSGYEGTYRSDPRADGEWYGDGGRRVVNPISREDLDCALASAREKAGPTTFTAGVRYLLVLKGGEALVGTCMGPYHADAPSISLRTDEGDLAVMLRTIRTTVKDDGIGDVPSDDSPEAVHVTFTCGHGGGVWPQDSQAGTSKYCLVCREVVTIEGAQVMPFRRPDR